MSETTAATVENTEVLVTEATTEGTTAVAEKPAKTKKEKAPKAPKPPKEPKVKDPIEVVLARDEAKLREKYPHIVPGTIADVNTYPEIGAKRSVEIACQYEGCSAKRRVATSDLAQVKYCSEHTRVARLERRKDARAAKAATKPPKAPKPPKEKKEKAPKADASVAATEANSTAEAQS